MTTWPDDDVILYDGVCVFCSRWIRFVAARDKDRRRTFLEAQGWRIPLGYVPAIGEVRAMEQHTARGFFQSVGHPSGPAVDAPAPQPTKTSKK